MVLPCGLAFVYPFASGVNARVLRQHRSRAVDKKRAQTLYKRDHDMAAKTAGQRKTKGILIRVTEAQKRSLARTAKRAGLGLSSWMLSVALHAAHKMKDV